MQAEIAISDLSPREHLVIACDALRHAKHKIEEYEDARHAELKEGVRQVELETANVRKAIFGAQSKNGMYLRFLEVTPTPVEEEPNAAVTSQSISTPKRESRTTQLAEAALSPLSTMSDFSPAVVKIAQRVTRGQKRAWDSGDGIDQSNASNTASGQAHRSAVAKVWYILVVVLGRELIDEDLILNLGLAEEIEGKKIMIEWRSMIPVLLDY